MSEPQEQLVDISKAERKLAQAEYFLRCLEAAPGEISKAQFGARPEPSELLDYNYSACLSAAQSAFVEKMFGEPDAQPDLFDQN
jgi:hypothetical protein